MDDLLCCLIKLLAKDITEKEASKFVDVYQYKKYCERVKNYNANNYLMSIHKDPEKILSFEEWCALGTESEKTNEHN